MRWGATTLVLAALASGAIAAQAPRAPRVSDRLLRTVTEALASERVLGRDNDTPGSSRAQDILIRRLQRAGRGLVPAGNRADGFRQPFVAEGLRGTNLLAVVRGRELPDEYVIVGAHYDHLGTRSDATGACRAFGTPGGDVCPGATDNATGSATVIAIGRALKKRPPRRSVVLALWDAEEDGLLGSFHYVNAPLVPLAQTIAYVNLDILGSRLLPSLATTSFAVGPETGTGLTELTRAAIAAEGLDTVPLSFVFGQGRSDYANFVAKSIPTVFFSDSTNGCYHTTADDLGVVDWTKLGTQARIALHLVSALADTEAPPAFVPLDAGFATYGDAVALAQVFTRGEPDTALFPPADREVLVGVRDTLGRIVADGPAAFDPGDVLSVLEAALEGIAAIQRLGCITRTGG